MWFCGIVRFIFIILFLGCSFLDSTVCFSELDDEFDLSNSIIEIDDLSLGGPEKDGIPAISEPNFVHASSDTFLNENDLVVGVVKGDEAKAFPIKILNWHEIVNDTIADEPVVITWCPLTHSAVVFNSEVTGDLLHFGVSGLVYNNNLVMFDRMYQSLWSQLMAMAVTGLPSGKYLKEVSSIVTSWEKWKAMHPKTLVLTTYTGYKRDYNYDPYSGYHKSRTPMFPMRHYDSRLPPKSLVIGVRLNSIPKAYPISHLKDHTSPISDTVGGVRIYVHKGPQNTAYVADAAGNVLPATIMYWFAWSAFHQDTLLYNVTPIKRTGHQIR